VQDPDQLLRLVDLEVDVAARLRQQDAPEPRMPGGRERRAGARRRFEQIDGVGEFTLEQIGVVGSLSPSRIDPLRSPGGTLRDKRFHGLAAPSRAANARASSYSPRSNSAGLAWTSASRYARLISVSGS